jgi:nitrate/TMAO reductase-like tetraheme cytochrome c subunit
MRRASEQFKRLSKPLKIGIQVGVLAVILAAVGTVGFIEYSAQPGFCTNCHIMQPYYDSWATSTHNDVPCIKCHYAPGVKAEAMGKFQAANQVARYVTGAYGTKPWAEIEDAACLRSGCHSLRKVEGVVSYRGVRFDHTQHLGELRRGKQLRCTSCHSQIVQGQHLAVTQTTCNLCHFNVVDHEQYVEDLVSCVSCHEEVTRGTGDADEQRCWTCHNRPDRIEEFENTTLVHRVHIAEHNVECTQCHTEIVHQLFSLKETAQLDCEACHRRVHEAQQQLYAGIGGHGSDDTPSSMFLARVSCTGCHELLRDVSAHESVRFAGEASCLSCHGIRYANILPSWQQEMDRKVRLASRVVEGAVRAAGSAPVRTRTQVDSLLGLARENVEFVELGKGAHNIAYADELLRASVELVEQAVRVGSLPYAVSRVDLGPRVSENVCLQCHLGVERSELSFRGTAFDHERHVLTAGLDCTSCHSPLDDHGKTRLASPSDCVGCHHAQIGARNCAECHAGPGGAPEAPVATEIGGFPHAAHAEAGLSCTMCHTAPNMSGASVDCVACHDFHHQPEADCLSCHRGGVQDRHALAFGHSQCSQCHGDKAKGITEWSRQVCTICHVNRVDHNAPVACHLCHEIAPLSGG